MSYQSLTRSSERLQLLVFWVLLAAFVFAWAMMFVHPSVTLLTFWLGLLFLAGGMITLAIYRRSLRHAARQALHDHQCPACGDPIERDPRRHGAWHCGSCGADFLDSGALT